MKNIALLQNNGIDVENSVRLLGSMESYDQILRQFLNDIVDRLNNIKLYKEQNDIFKYALEIHNLKNDSKCLGFTKLASIAYQHETASKQNDIDYIYSHYNELIIETVRIITIARQYNGQYANTNVVEKSATKTIIIADDSDIIRKFVSNVLTNEFNVLEAENGSQVIDLIEHNNNKKIDCILLDLNMPNLNGFDVLEYFKQNNLFEKIPISLISGNETKDSIDKAFQYPIIDMIHKPFNENNLKRIVDRTIALHKSL